MRLSLCQRDILEWLIAYPQVEITCNPPSTPQWTMGWCNEEARKHMLGTMPILAPYFGITQQQMDAAVPIVKPRTEGTPRITKQTFDALHVRGLIQAIKYRPKDGCFSEMYYYQITSRGQCALLNSQLEGR